MSISRPLFQRFDTFLNAAVANNGTFTVGYPGSTTQQDFDTGLGVGGGVVINDGDKWTVAAAQVSFAFGASLITVTNLSGGPWAINSKVSIEMDQQPGNAGELVQIPVNLVALANGAMFNPGFRFGIIGTLEYYEAMIKTPVTTAAKLATIQPTINGVAVTGGALALTSANATPAGIILPAPLITGANAIAAASKIGFLVSGVTAFVEGEIVLFLRLRASNPNAY
jgi:hypothetical protein